MPDGVNIPGGPAFIGLPQPPDVPCDPTGDGWRGPPGPPGPSGVGVFLPLVGGTMTGPIVLPGDPTTDLQAASKHYVDQQTAVGTPPGGPFLPLTGGTLSGPLNGTTAVMSGQITASDGQPVKLQLLGGGGTGTVQSIGGSLTLQSATGSNLILKPQSAGNVVNAKHGMTLDLFTNGTPTPIAGHIIGFNVGGNDNLVASAGVWHFNVGANVGALPWTAGEVISSLSQQRNSGGNIYSNTTTGTCGATPPSGTGTSSDGAVAWSYVASDFVSNRVASNANLTIRGTTGPTASPGARQWIAHAGTFIGSANQGGTGNASSTALGTGYAGSDQAWLYNGATNWAAIVGREIDVGIFNQGSGTLPSAKSRWGLNLVSFGDYQGVQDDDAIIFGSTYANSSGIPFRTLFHISEGALQYGGTYQSAAIMQYYPRPPGSLAGLAYSNPAANLGIDFQNVVFTTAAFRGPSNSGIDANGAVFSGAARIRTTQTAVEIDAPGSISNGVVWANAASVGFMVGDCLYDPAGSGLVVKVLTVDGTGKPTSVSDDPAQGGRRGAVTGATPSNPLTLAGGSGGTLATPAQVTVTWVRISALSLQPSGGAVQVGSGCIAANGSVATVLGSLGPVGSHTAVQEWIAIKNASGVTRYVPAF